jgi:hypothetical protein
VSDDSPYCTTPFCDGPCDDPHDIPRPVETIIGEAGSACPDCDTSGFGMITEYRMDERAVHFVVLWHADTCPSLINGGYLIANLPQTSLKTGIAITDALGRITTEDIRGAWRSVNHDQMLARHDRGECTLPERTVETARKIAAREARQAARRGGNTSDMTADPAQPG